VDLVGADGAVLMSLSPGNVFGFVDSQLGKPRSSNAVARRPAGCSYVSPSSLSPPASPPPGSPRGGGGDNLPVQVAAISMASLERMSADHPRIAVKLMKVLLRQSSLELSYA